MLEIDILFRGSDILRDKSQLAASFFVAGSCSASDDGIDGEIDSGEVRDEGVRERRRAKSGRGAGRYMPSG